MKSVGPFSDQLVGARSVELRDRSFDDGVVPPAGPVSPRPSLDSHHLAAQTGPTPKRGHVPLVVVIVYSSIMIRIRQDLPSPDATFELVKDVAAQAITGTNRGRQAHRSGNPLVAGSSPAPHI
jgi:hypothetical protein